MTNKACCLVGAQFPTPASCTNCAPLPNRSLQSTKPVYDLGEFQYFNIYPNPSSGNFIVEKISDFKFNGNVSIAMYNTLSQGVYKNRDFTEKSNKITVSIQPGRYYYIISDELNCNLQKGKILIE